MTGSDERPERSGGDELEFEPSEGWLEVDPEQEGRERFETALNRTMVRMETERRIATEEERERLRGLLSAWELEALWPEYDDDIPDWGTIEEQLDRPPAEGYQRIHPDDLAVLLAATRANEATKDVHIGRGYTPLALQSVKSATGLIQKRKAAQARLGCDRLPTGLRLSYDAIGEQAGLGRDRVRQIEALIEAGWNPRESHPEFPAKPGFVNLPTLPELARLRKRGRVGE